MTGPTLSAISAPATAPARVSGAWATALLALVAFLAAMHQNVLSILLVPVQHDLQLSDAAMGALAGTAFAIVYGLASLPLARLADRGNRRNLLVAALGVWSVATALCGLAANVFHLLVARIGVAGALAAQPPATFSMVGDLAPPARRGAAISVVVFGNSLGFGVGAYVTGLLNDHYGWRLTMALLAAPGLLMAPLLLMTLREPARVQDAAESSTPVGMIEGFRQIAGVRTFWPLLAGFVILNVAYSGFLAWMPAFLMRVHGLSTTNMGAAFGLVTVCGAVSNVAGGPLTDRLAGRRQRWRLYYCVVTAVLSAPLLAAGLLVGALPLALAGIAGFALVSGGLTTVCTAAFLAISPARLRGQVIAVMNLGVFLVAGGLAPPLFGLATDALKGAYGEGALRYGLQLAPAAVLIAAALFWLASRTCDGDAIDTIDPAERSTP
jgi:predicted MFS family arabinose efflux permease